MDFIFKASSGSAVARSLNDVSFLCVVFESRSFWRESSSAGVAGRLELSLVDPTSIRDDDLTPTVVEGVDASLSLPPLSSASIRLFAALVRIPAPTGFSASLDLTSDDSSVFLNFLIPIFGFLFINFEVDAHCECRGDFP